MKMKFNANDLFTQVKKATVASKNLLEKSKNHSKIKEYEKRIMEHKSNIGSYVYENEVSIDDGFVISNINAIDRLVNEIDKLRRKSSGEEK